MVDIFYAYFLNTDQLRCVAPFSIRRRVVTVLRMPHKRTGCTIGVCPHIGKAIFYNIVTGTGCESARMCVCSNGSVYGVAVFNKAADGPKDIARTTASIHINVLCVAV